MLSENLKIANLMSDLNWERNWAGKMGKHCICHSLSLIHVIWYVVWIFSNENSVDEMLWWAWCEFWACKCPNSLYKNVSLLPFNPVQSLPSVSDKTSHFMDWSCRLWWFSWWAIIMNPCIFYLKKFGISVNEFRNEMWCIWQKCFVSQSKNLALFCLAMAAWSTKFKLQFEYLAVNVLEYKNIKYFLILWHYAEIFSERLLFACSFWSPDIIPLDLRCGVCDRMFYNEWTFHGVQNILCANVSILFVKMACHNIRESIVPLCLRVASCLGTQDTIW